MYELEDEAVMASTHSHIHRKSQIVTSVYVCSIFMQSSWSSLSFFFIFFFWPELFNNFLDLPSFGQGVYRVVVSFGMLCKFVRTLPGTSLTNVTYV